MSRMRPVRWMISIVIAGAVVVGVVLVVSQTTDNGSAAPVTTASPLSPASVTRGDLVKTSKADGTLEYSDTLTVWHRIAGQKATAASGSNNASNGAASRDNNGQFGGSVGGSTRAVHAPSQVTTPSTPGGPSTTTCAPSSSTSAPPTSGSLAPTALDPCSTPGGGAGGGAARPGGGAFSGGSAASPAVTRITQTVTSIASVGTSIANGDVLYTIDSQPVIALIGAVPEWRTLSTSSSDGTDIAQLEQALVDLGYDADGAVAVDEHFDSNTEAMVKRWQQGLGVTATGKVALGSIVFIPRPSTVATVARTVGDEVGDADEMLTLAGKSQRVVIDVPAGDEQYWAPGLAVSIGSAPGTVIVLQSIDRNSTAIVQAIVVPDALIDGAENGATLTVSAELVIARDVFLIPSQALVSRVDGTYAVQVVGQNDVVSWTPVTLEGVAGLRAGVLGDGLEDGVTVLAPSA